MFCKKSANFGVKSPTGVPSSESGSQQSKYNAEIIGERIAIRIGSDEESNRGIGKGHWKTAGAYAVVSVLVAVPYEYIKKYLFGQ